MSNSRNIPKLRFVVPWDRLFDLRHLIPECKLLNAWEWPAAMVAGQRTRIFENLEGLDESIGRQVFDKTCAKCLYRSGCYDVQRVLDSEVETRKMIACVKARARLTPNTIRKPRR